MKKELLDYLVCPGCKGKLKIDTVHTRDKDEIMEGAVTCDNGHEFPIKGGLPRMFYEITEGMKKTATAFSKEWNAFDYEDPEDNTWPGLDEEKRISRFMTAFNIKPDDLKGKVVLDAGCGNGRLSFSLTKFGAKVIGTDVSSSVEKAFRFYKNDRLFYVQGDLMHIPFNSGSFDYVWCSGVLMCTPNTKQGFDSIAPLVKKGGKLYVWVCGYPTTIRYEIIWSLWRIIIKCPEVIQRIIGFFTTLGTSFTACLRGERFSKRLIRQQKRMYYDLIVPYYDFFTQEEVASWFKEHGFTDINVPIEDYETFCGFGTSGIRK